LGQTEDEKPLSRALDLIFQGFHVKIGGAGAGEAQAFGGEESDADVAAFDEGTAVVYAALRSEAVFFFAVKRADF